MITGKVWKYGENVNTDVIFPGKYTYTITDKNEMAKHAMEDLDPSFAKEVQKGDIIVAGKNFGCGSSREQAATCLKYAGVAAIVAPSFSRIFFRNAINEGLLLIINGDSIDHIQKGDTIDIDLAKGEIKKSGKSFKFFPLPESVRGIIEDGGLIPHLKKKFATEKK